LPFIQIEKNKEERSPDNFSFSKVEKLSLETKI